MNIGNTIRTFRHLKKMTHKEVAFQLGITQQAYSKIERNESNISIDRLYNIAQVLEVDTNQLLVHSLQKKSISTPHLESLKTIDKGSLLNTELTEIPSDTITLTKLSTKTIPDTMSETHVLWKIIEYQRLEMESLRNEKMELLKVLQQLEVLKKL